ncbi:MAG: alpha-glucan family phosphorylase [Elusimicrobia bacterium]|nr:alpha-glucan family phosphorylase [Elusimicrobiota bacterium]
MEIALDPRMRTYAGGLGVLAGDTVRAAADLGLPLVAVTLVHRSGYFEQRFDAEGRQSELPAAWSPEELLEPVSARISLGLEGRAVHIRAWRKEVEGREGSVPVYFLDTDVPENTAGDRALTGTLYGGDERYRLRQEAVLGLGAFALLRALHPEPPRVYHLNEGHAALLTLAVLAEASLGGNAAAAGAAERERARAQCVFTTHTPVPAGHDRFSMALVRDVLGEELASAIEANGCAPDGVLNMTHLALSLSRYVNGVAMRHGEVAQGMFPGYPMNAITNGVHAVMWTADPIARVHDRHIPEWRRDGHYLRYAITCPLEEIRAAHAEAKAALLDHVHRGTARTLDPSVLTIGFARRATAYKRADLVFSDLERLRAISRARRLQLVFAGKAHPRDDGGKDIIARVHAAARALGADLAVVYLEEHDLELAKVLCAGVDVWLNTPQKPLEASGTSGMKAALNGVPSLSVLDGWWVEGHVEGVTGWGIGDASATGDPVLEVTDLYDKLERVVAPLYYDRPLAFAEVMRSAIALNGSFFNAQRMVEQYVQNAYRLKEGAA